MHKQEFSLSVKDVSGEGTFEGYASTFGGAPDSYGDVISVGAFADSLVKHRREGTMPLMLFGHNSSDLPIGNWVDMAEDGKGLWAKGQIAMDDPLGIRVHSALKQKRVRGLSIGYETKSSRPDDKRPGVTFLDAVHLWEVSVVNFPANRRSLVDTVKSEMDPARWWAIHDRLREFDGSNDGADLKKEIEDMLQIEACPKSLRPFFAKRIVGGRSESGRQPHRRESEGEKAQRLAALHDAVRAFLPTKD